MNTNLTKKLVLGMTAILFSCNVFSQTFTEITAIALPGLSNGSVAWGDYDNDGDYDILLTGFGSDDLMVMKIYRNNGSNSFTDQPGIFLTPIPTSLNSYVTTIALWADFDNDGFLDIIFNGPSTYGNNIFMIYRNLGNNTFSLQNSTEYLTFDSNTIECGDYDNDGDQDFLMTSNNSTRIFQNKGGFIFTELISTGIEGLAKGTARWGDYDNDGDLDIVISGRTGIFQGATKVYQNLGNNQFTPQTGIDLPSVSGASTEWGDYNNDGLLDLLLTGGYNNSIAKNNGNNTFTPLYIIPNETYTGFFRWGDLDNDGDLDIISAGIDGSTNISTKIYINNGNNTFTTATGITIDGVKECAIDLVDYDNDGDLDILISGNKGASKITKVFRNGTVPVNASPSAPTGLTVSSSGSDIILKWRAVSNDNTPKKAISYNIMAGTSSGAINLISPASSSSGFRKISGMGNCQLDTTFIIRNIKKGTYYWKVQAVDNSFKGSPFSVESSFTYSASFQAYGLKASPVGAKEATLSWSRGNGTNCIVFMKEANTGTALPVNNTTYTASSIFKSGTQIGTSGWYCVARGNLTTVNTTGLKANTDYIFQVFEFDGVAGAEVYNTQTVTGNPLTFKTGSFTEVKNANLLPGVNNTFGSEQSSSSIWFDFDNDNDLDLLLVGISSSKLYRNDLKDVFTLMPVTLSSGYGAACGDFNNDGWIDILISNTTMNLYRNNGNSTFTEVTGHLLPGNYSGSVYFGDFDNDGDLDVSMTGESTIDGRIAKVFRNNGDNTFTEQTTIKLTGVTGVNSLAKWGDYDNDGNIDLLVSGFDPSHTVIARVYRNSGDNTFVEQKGIVLSTSYGTSYDWGDYDNDGDLDILAANNNLYDFNIKSTVYRNDGVNLFTAQTSISMSAAGFGSCSWGDYDGDGDLDILLTGFTDGYLPVTKIYKNNGNNSFTEDPACQIPALGWSSASWGDYDNDGDLDFVVQGTNSNAAVAKIYRNDIGVVNIKPAAPVAAPAVVNKSDVTLIWKHVRSDNTLFRAMSYNVRVGTSASGFNRVSPHASPTGYRRISAMGNAYLDTTFVLKKLPMGNYFWSVQAVDNGFAGGTPSTEGTFSIVPVQAQNLSAKIINDNSLLLKWERGNGDRCVVFCKQTASGSAVPVNNTGYVADSEYSFGSQIGSSGWYAVYNGRADSVMVTGLSSSKMYSFHIFEYMGTFGSEQYFTQVVDGNPGVFSTSLFTEQSGITFSNNIQYNNIAWGDYDNDSFIDFILPGFPTRIYRNKGDNTFIEKTAIAIADINWGDVAWGDYDNDGDLDLAITGGTVNSYPPSVPVTKIYRNDGGDIFTEQTLISLPQLYYSSVSWGDYDSDGDVDLLLTGATGVSPDFNPVSKIYENNANGTFSEKTQISLTGVLKGSGKWIDFDNDGDPDIAITGAIDYQEYGNGITKLYRNNGNKTFTDITRNQLPGFGYSNSTWGDYDNDGDPDVILTTRGGMYLFENLGNSSFSQHIYISLPYQGACYPAWGDYDNDGYLDILLTNPGLDTKLFRNTHGVSPPDAISQWFNKQDDAAIGSAGYEFVNWIDYDNDGDLDILFAKSNATKIFKNNLVMKSGVFKPNITPLKPKGLIATNTPAGVVLKWDPVPDDETSYKTMSYNIGIGTSKSSFNVNPTNSSAGGYRKIPAIGNTYLNTTYTVKNLTSQKYYWSVQAVDQALKGGGWAAIDSFIVKNTEAFFTFDTVCHGFPTHFTDQSVATDGIASRKWDFTDGSTSTLQHPVHLFATGGTYNVKLVVTSTTGTKDSLITPVIVNKRASTGFTAPNTCQGSSVAIINTTNVNGLTISSWYWNFGDGTTSVAKDPPSHGYLGPGNYNVLLKALAANGCIDSTIKIVSVVAKPVAAITTNTPLSFCEGDSVILSVTKSSTYSYEWRLNGTKQTYGDSSRFVAKLPGNYTVKVANSTTTNCETTSDPEAVTIKPNPFKPGILTENYTDKTCPGDKQIRLYVDQPVTGYNYQWFRNGSPISSATTSSYQDYLDAGDYKVEASLSGCRATSDIKKLEFPNAPPKPVIFAQDGPNVWYLVSSVTNADTYRWYYKGTAIPGAASYYYVAGKNFGTYFVIISKEGCFVRSDDITIPTGTTGIDDGDPFEGLNIYPNPTNGLITIEMDNMIIDDLYVSVVAQNGKEILKTRFEKTTTHFSAQVDLSGQARGIYFVSLSIDKYKSNRKIIIK